MTIAAREVFPARAGMNRSRFGYYVRHSLVIDKIRQAKLAGTFEEILQAPDRLAPYRLAAAIAAADAQRRSFSAASSRF